MSFKQVAQDTSTTDSELGSLDCWCFKATMVFKVACNRSLLHGTIHHLSVTSATVIVSWVGETGRCGVQLEATRLASSTQLPCQSSTATIQSSRMLPTMSRFGYKAAYWTDHKACTLLTALVPSTVPMLISASEHAPAQRSHSATLEHASCNVNRQ